MMGCAVIGCGGISGVHLPVLKMMPNVQIKAVCDTDPARLHRAAETYGATPYRDYKEAIDREDVQVVHLCTPHYLHAPMALYALNAGKRVLTEKPVASEVQDALAMIKAAQGRLGVCFQNRYNASVEAVRAIIEEGPMGALLSMRGQVAWHRTAPYYTQSGWRGAWDTEGGGVLINQAIHTLDLMLWLGGEPTSVSGAVSTDLLDGVIQVEDSAHFTMRYRDGKSATFYATTANACDAPIEIEFFLEKGSLLIKGESLIRKDESGEHILYVPDKAATGAKAYWGTGHPALIQDFYECAREDRPFWIDGEEAIKSLIVLKSVYRSSSERRPVDINEWRRSEHAGF